MTLSLLPDSAPFDQEQRAWLNGFFAGLLNLQETDGAATGIVQGLAQQALEGPEAAAEEEDEEEPWHDPALQMDERMEMAAEKPLPKRLMAAMAQLDCGACGYLCKSYSAAIADGSEKSLTLCAPGGKETSKMLKKIIKEEKAGGGAGLGNGSDQAGQTAVSQAPPAEVGYSRANPCAATIKTVANLNQEGSKKHTSHVEINLNGHDFSYNVGDALGVYPTNCNDLVAELIQRLELPSTKLVSSPRGRETSLEEALLADVNLSMATEELAELMLESATDDAAREALQTLLNTEDAIDDLDVLDLLQEYPQVSLDVDRFLATLEPLAPRLYSIASSLKAHPKEVHLTVGKVTFEKRGRLRKGVASTMFSDRIQPGQEVRVFVQPSHGFTVPQDPKAPMIMVGPGTGIAPFMAFLQERKSTGADGPNWLFFGDQQQATDFLYRDHLEEYKTAGFLTRLDTAFSRDQEKKVYVQDRMRENAEELYQWLEQGGYFFVCGDASRMARDVDQALHEVIEKAGGKSPEEAKQYVANLTAEKRYMRDVY
ncbi:Assimilatory nitrate reductase large subunit [Planctomycetales bacterium 10988]|nr:Assimilatory nitrate reductase large subunit [Planctomycetales bacterium 10988]